MNTQEKEVIKKVNAQFAKLDEFQKLLRIEAFGMQEIETNDVHIDFPFGPSRETIPALTHKVMRFQLGKYSGLIWNVDNDWNFAEIAFDENVRENYVYVKHEVLRRTAKAFEIPEGFTIKDGKVSDCDPLYRSDLENIKREALIK